MLSIIIVVFLLVFSFFLSRHTLKMSTEIKIIETTLSIQQNLLSVFHVIIQTSQYKVSLVRYPFDFVEFHQKIRLYYSKTKIGLPSLQSPQSQFSSKLKSFHNLLPRKSNAEKIQRYLERCFAHPVLSNSSLLKDFTRVQRDEDTFILLPTSDDMKAIPPIPPTLEDFDLIKVLGKGCIGKVLLVRSKKSNQLYALKTMQKKKILDQKELDHIQAERDITIRLRNQPFIVHLHHVFQSESALFFLLDYHPGGDLAAQLATRYSFPPETVRMYAAEIVQGLSVIHQHGIVYRDLKPENVLISESGHLVLADFGLSKMLTETDSEGIPLTQTFCGTAEYLAPEILLGEPYTFVVDFWSLGTLLYEMLTGTVS
ncbi:kinase-like domain-containing protein [Sporodiniella umbellata]|nr:kinase-like domain-containing protein [Sporodiniella umbellata]